MATNPAPAPWSAPPAPVRQLWQVPTFLLGLAALATFFLARPLWRTPLAQGRSQLAEARRLLQRPDGDPYRAAALARSYLDRLGLDAEGAGEAYFLLGGALLRIARAAPGDKPAPEWAQARENLEKAERLGVPEDDVPVLRFRLGVCGAHTSMEPRRVAGLLARSVEEGDDKVEGYQLLARAYLSLPKPDRAAALKANEALRQLPLVGEEVLGPARLQAGELLLALHRPAEARSVLEKVSKAAAPAVLARARSLRARSLQDEGKWAEAAALWEEVLGDRRRPPDDPVTVLYNLGLCRRRLEQYADAARAWEKCLKLRTDGAAAASANLGLAEAYLAEAPLPTAADAFERAVRNVHRPEEWPTTFVSLRQARAAFEQGSTTYRDKGDFERALRVAKAYERLAEQGRAALLRGQAAEAWARALEGAAPRGGPPVRKDPARARELYRLAGASYGEAASLARTPRQESERLWLSAGASLRAQDATRAVPALRRFLDLNQHPDFAGEACYLLGEALRWLKQEREAVAAYLDCLKYEGRFAYRAAFRIGEAALRRGDVDRAVDVLKKNVSQMHASGPDPEALERSLFALGGALYRQGKYQEAEHNLSEALKKFPDSPRAVRGRLQRADACRGLAQSLDDTVKHAGTDQAKKHYEELQRDWYLEAARQYQALAKLPKDALSAALAARELADVPFNEAECRFRGGQFAEALKLYTALAEPDKGGAARLRALGGLSRCHAALEWVAEIKAKEAATPAQKESHRAEAQKQSAYFQQRLVEIRVALKQVDPDTRRAWENWLQTVSKQP